MTNLEGVVPALGEALTKRGYEQLTQVQHQMLAPEIIESDLLVSAQTGSGKTVAFGIALAPNLLDDNDKFEFTDLPMAVVVAPTRELAMQVTRELTWLYAPAGGKIVSCVGGMDSRDERRALSRGAHIVVGTPGRLCDHIKRGSLDMTLLRAVVLDEADEMLDLGFREELELILDAAPEDRRTLMFSATVPKAIATLAKRYQNDAVRIKTTAEQKQHVDIEYNAYTCAPDDEENAIINVLRYYEAKNALVFCGTRAAVNRMTSRFNNRGFSVVALSGELSQNERTHALQAMRDGRARVCIATDVAARGIDLPNLELVIHADIPRNPESLLHRSGRTGRAGRKGVSALIIPPAWRKRTDRLLNNAKSEATWANPPSAEQVKAKDNERLLSDPNLIETPSENEITFAAQLLEQHSAEHIAAAFIRLHQKGKSAPEELVDLATYKPAPREKGKEVQQTLREDFEGGVWFSLSVGRNERAEPRWLLPMLCTAGNLSKPQIGAIKITAEETYVEIKPDAVEGFVKSVGEEMRLERGIILTQLAEAPVVTVVSRDKPGRFKDGPKGDRGGKDRGRGGDRRSEGRGDKKFGDKKFGDKKFGDKKFADKKGGDKKFGDKKPDWKNKSKEGEGDFKRDKSKGEKTWAKSEDRKPSPKADQGKSASVNAEEFAKKKPKDKKPKKPKKAKTKINWES